MILLVKVDCPVCRIAKGNVYEFKMLIQNVQIILRILGCPTRMLLY